MKFYEIDWSELDSTISTSDIYLFEGKLLVSDEEIANKVCNYLQKRYPTYNIVVNNTRNWDHWTSVFKKEIILYNEKF